MIEKNPFGYFIPEGATKLIVGSFPCFNGADYGDWFYSGSGRNLFWRLLSDVYGMPAGSRAEMMALCEEHGIALTDVASEVIRKKGDCSDANLKIVTYNRAGIQACLDAGISKVFFTGKFVEHHFRRLFPDLVIGNHVLPSPSPTANRHLGTREEYRQLLGSGTIDSIYGYRLMRYKELLTAV